jgi:hypothetical protein
MRRALVLSILVATASPAWAVDHGARINEIGLSKAGDQTVQFIEITDTFGGEPYPNAPYRLEFFDDHAVSIGTVTLSISGQNSKWYVATAVADTAYGTTRNDLLTVALPQNGQVCFVRNVGGNISCVAWGCIVTFVPAVVRAPTPPDNMTASRQPDGTFQITTPTPNNTTNTAGSTIAACPTDPMDMPPDAAVAPHDAPNANNGDTTTPGGGGGCCQTSSRDAAGASLLALATLVTIRRRRARVDRPH